MTKAELEEQIKEAFRHIAKYNDEMGRCQQDISSIKTDLTWIKKGIWTVAAATIGNIVGSIIK